MTDADRIEALESEVSRLKTAIADLRKETEDAIFTAARETLAISAREAERRERSRMAFGVDISQALKRARA